MITFICFVGVDSLSKREHAQSFRYAKTHGKYTEEELDVKLTHVEPKDWLDRAAFSSVKAVRFLFDQGENTRIHVTSCATLDCVVLAGWFCVSLSVLICAGPSVDQLFAMAAWIINFSFQHTLLENIKLLDGTVVKSPKIKYSTAQSTSNPSPPSQEWSPPSFVTFVRCAT